LYFLSYYTLVLVSKRLKNKSNKNPADPKLLNGSVHLRKVLLLAALEGSNVLYKCKQKFSNNCRGKKENMVLTTFAIIFGSTIMVKGRKKCAQKSMS